MKETNPDLMKQIENLYRVSLAARWFLVIFSWLTLGSLGIWGLRGEIPLWLDHFTWTALRYGIAYNRMASLAIAFCVGLTAAVLIRQSLNILRGGISPEEKLTLEKQVKKILKKGPRHPLWKWVIKGT